MYEKLDEKYWKKQDYLLYLNDVLANMVKQNNQKTLTQFKIEMNEEQSKEFEKLDDNSDLFEWLDNNGFHEKALHGFECHMFFSLLQDFCFLFMNL